MDNLKELSALTALNNMMAKGWFDICTINSIAEMMGINPKCEAYRILHPLHCVHFDKMPDELRKAIPGLVQECLGIAPIFRFKTMAQKTINVTPQQEPKIKRGLLRLFAKT